MHLPTFARARRSRKQQAGQGLVEVALILPIFFAIFFGLIDVGKLLYTNAALSQAAREGARLAAAEAGWIGLAATDPACVLSPDLIVPAVNPGAHVCRASVALLKQDVVSAVNRMAVTLDPLTIANVYLSCNTGQAGDLPPSGDWTETAGGASPVGNGCRTSANAPIASHGFLVSVRIKYTYHPITPVISQVSVPLSASTTMVIN
jgi:TadE-like protein